jgi:SAM-dependent methyltransferase
VLAWEQARLDALVADVFGYNAVQLGLRELDALRANRMPLAFFAGEEFQSPQAANGEASACGSTENFRPRVATRLDELPFAAQSIDLAVLPHVLEFAADPHQVLREVERVLIPEGQVVISGFNPFSLWGARQAVGRAFDARYVPCAGKFLALPRLKDWLKLLSFEVDRGHFGCYRLPVRSERGFARCGFLEKAGDRWWPICGAVYLISAVKRVRGMRLIGPAWVESKPAVASLNPVPTPSVTVDRNRGCADG